MTKTAKNLILLLTLLFSIQNAYCYVLNYDELYNNIFSQVQKQTKKDVLKYSSDFEIKLSGIPKEKILTNDSIPPKITVISQNSTFSPTSYKRVYIKDLKNNLIKSFPLMVQTKVYKNVLISQDTIPFGKPITKNNTKLEKREISRNLDNVLLELPKNSIAKRNFQKGSIIYKNSIKSQAVVFRNSLININFISSTGFEIKVQGRALKDGAIGETILVKSDKYNKTYSATIDSTSQVTVRI